MNQKNMPSDLTRLGPTILDSVDESLRGILGNVVAEAVYNHLQQIHSLPKHEIPLQLTKFSAALRIIFDTASPVIERAIAKRVSAKLGLNFVARPNDYTLQDYLADAVVEKAARMRKMPRQVSEEEMQEVIDFAKTLKPTEHVILFYAQPELKRRLLFAYLKAGLDNGEAAAYVTSQETPELIKQAMRTHGIDVELLEKSHAMQVIPYTEWYYLDGYFDISRTMSLWEKLYDETKSLGFRGLRVTGEMYCFFERGQLNELVAYEKALHKKLGLPMAAVCAYDTSKVPVETFRELIAAHGNSLFLGPELRIVA